MPALQHVSLFSGVGGFELAMAEAGIPTLAACEIDKKARGVLHDRFPGVHIYHDVREVTGDSLRSLGAVPGQTVLSAGWPCQGNSVAGSRGGMDDARSGLWSEVVRILAELRPAWFVGENVPGLLSVAGGRDFATIGWAADRALEAAVRCYVAFYSTPAVVLHHNAPDQPNPHITTRRAAVAACLPAGSPWRAVAAANGGLR